MALRRRATNRHRSRLKESRKDGPARHFDCSTARVSLLSPTSPEPQPWKEVALCPVGAPRLTLSPIVLLSEAKALSRSVSLATTRKGRSGIESLPGIPWLFGGWDSDSIWRNRVEFDFCKQSAHFTNEQLPTFRVFRHLEPREGFFKLSE